MRAAAIAVFLCSISGVVHAADQSVFGASIWNGMGPATLARPPVLYFRLGDFRGILEKTTLDDVRSQLGGVIVPNGEDAAGGEYRLCYALANRTQLVRLSSNAEMGGNDHQIDGMIAEFRQPGRAIPPGCHVPPQKFSSFALGDGFRLGMKSADLVGALGAPSTGKPGSRNGQLAYVYDKTVAETPDDPAITGSAITPDDRKICSIDDSLALKVRGGNVTELLAKRVTSC